MLESFALAPPPKAYPPLYPLLYPLKQNSVSNREH